MMTNEEFDGWCHGPRRKAPLLPVVYHILPHTYLTMRGFKCELQCAVYRAPARPHHLTRAYDSATVGGFCQNHAGV